MLNDVKRKIKGGPLTVPKSDEIGWEPYERQEEHPGSALDNPAATRLQASIKRKKQIKTLGNMRWVNEMAQNETNRGAANKLTASLKRTKQQTEYEQEVVMDRETKAKSTKISRDI